MSEFNDKLMDDLNRLIDADSPASADDLKSILKSYTRQAKRFQRIFDRSDKQQATLLKLNESLDDTNLLLNEKSHEAEEATRAKSLFLATMSHEIRTPMNGILGMAELLKSTPLNAEQHAKLAIIQSSSENLLGIINDILDFSKIEAGKLDIEHISFNPNTLLDSVGGVISGYLRAKPLDFVVHSTMDEGSEFIGDPSRINQILLNLMSNAVKFTESGAVSLTADYHDGFLSFVVRDTGIGLTPKQVGSLFQAFQQADTSTTRKFGGTGLGLAISQRLAELMGGIITCESVVGEGTAFTLSIPVDCENPMMLADKKELKPNDLSGEYLMLVGDTPTTQQLLKDAQKMGIETQLLTEEEAVDALAYADNTPGQVILDGICLLNELEWELATALCEDWPVVTILSTPFSEQYADFKALDWCDNVTDKPIRGQRLLNARYFPEDVALKNDTKKVKFEPAIVLVAEDNEVNREVLKQQITSLGLSCEFYENGALALEAYLINPSKYDLVLTDWQMPVMHGLDLTKCIRLFENINALTPTPLVALTANVSTDLDTQWLASGVNLILRKPIKLCGLTDALKDFLPTQDIVETVTEVIETRTEEAPVASSLSTPHLPNDLNTLNPAIDLRVMEDIFGTGSEDIIKNSLGLFKTSMQAEWALINDAITQADLKKIAGLCHKMEGAAATAGANDFYQSLLAVHNEVNGQQTINQAHWQTCQREYEALQNWLTQYLT